MRQVLGPGALGRPRGIGWRGRWERGSGWGIHVTPWLFHVNIWQNPLQCCEVISLQLIKRKKKVIHSLRNYKSTVGIPLLGFCGWVHPKDGHTRLTWEMDRPPASSSPPCGYSGLIGNPWHHDKYMVQQSTTNSQAANYLIGEIWKSRMADFREHFVPEPQSH